MSEQTDPPMTAIGPSLRLSWWDRFLIGIAPRWGMSRVHARAAAWAMTSVASRHYDAAGRGPRTKSWHRTSSDANAANGPAISSLRELSRELRRNNGWARRGIQAITNNTIGWGIQPKATGAGPEVAARAIEIWNRWAASPRADFDGRLPFAGLQRLVMETVVESGEALIVRRRARTSDRLPIPLRVQVLEPDYLDTAKDGVAGEGGGPIVQGVEFDHHGRRVAYWIYTTHPGSSRLAGARFDSQRVPASDVIHVYRVERPGQVRGVPWLASAIVRLNDFDEYEDAALLQQKIAACFAVFITDVDGAADPLAKQKADNPKVEEIQPGHAAYLPPGRNVAFATPPGVTDTSFTTRNLRRIAASLGVTYEDLTGDYSMVNFSSARMARLAHWANVNDWRWNLVIPACDGVWGWAMEHAAALEGWPEAPTADWAPPPMPMLEPEKEGLAYQRLVRSGAMTLFQMIRERGEDPIAHLDEIAQADKALDDRKIVLDSDARRTSSAGLAQQASQQGGKAGGGADAAESDEE